MREIKRTDIVGSRIIDIYETYELRDGLDTRMIYFTVDRGFTFLLPFAGAIWTDSELPPAAARLEEFVIKNFTIGTDWFGRLRLKKTGSTRVDIAKRIKERTISGVYCGPFDDSLDFYYPPEAILLFDDGSRVSNTMVAPHGTGSAGLYYFEPGSEDCTSIDQMVDFFTIPPQTR